MIFYPAIDLKDGQCVRLLRGEMDQATAYSGDPAGQARTFADAGCAWLHVVDLNGAFAGSPVNAPAVEAILAAVQIPIQLGGGIRDMETVDLWLDKGVRRVILGTAALKNPELVIAACTQYPDRVAVGIDARGGRVAVEGWAETSDMIAQDLALKFEDAGVAAIIYTDIERDGAMQGPNVAATIDLARAISTPVIASGGVASMDDLAVLKDAGGDILDGVISGRAVYDGRIDPAAAQTLLSGREGR
jgi:phosphoribosylformimino-5-aminoimidazole carboxamide ribotide isomerase